MISEFIRTYGLLAVLTAYTVVAAAAKSRPECSASEIIPRLLVMMPTIAFREVRATATRREDTATLFFSCDDLTSSILHLSV
jgi:hypothetical protein